jgi:alkyl hydroperoxide reductase subunit D
MNLNDLIDKVPAYARDLKLNFSSLLQQPALTEQQTWGTVAATAMASRNDEFTRAALAEAAEHLTPQVLEAAKGAAAIMGMNNVYYRFLHLVSNENYRTMRAGLRMNIIRNHGVDPLDFELWCVAVSAINGCGACVDSHEKVLREKGVSEETILSSIRLAAVVHALATVFDAERVAAAEPSVSIETAV